MFKSQKKLLLYQLDIYNIIYIAILKIFFSEIFYIKISGCIQNLAIIKILQRFKINWMNFQDYDIGEIYCESIKNNINFSDYISLILTEKIWDADIKSIYLKKDYLAACLFLKIQKEYQKIFEIFEISKILSKNHNKISILLHKDFFTKSIYEKYYSYYSFAMLPIVNFSFLRIFLNLLLFISSALYDIFFSLLRFNNNFSSYSKKLKKNIKKKVIYFPHKGIFYLDRLKDQFYSLNKNSPLNKENITHIEWSSNDIDKKSSIFYNKNKISLEIWDSLTYRKFHLISNAKLILKKISILFKLYNYNILYLFLLSVFQILKAQEKLLHFKDARLALVGYDFLFPLELSLALKKAGIKTVCMQERIVQSAYSHKMIFDHYFVVGPKSYKILTKRMSKTILNFHKYYLWHTNKANLKKHKFKKNKNLNCLIIDMHSENDWYSNGNMLNNWKNNKNFYEIIIELAKKYTNINFLIKSKNYSWTKIFFFSETVQKIENMPNINILKDSKKWSPENCIAYVDFAIARHSSLSDQMLYINKPVLICDLDGFPSKHFSFGKDIICKSKIDLEKKFTLLVNNILGYNQKLNKTRKSLFYYNSIVNLKVFLETKLKQ